MARLVDDLLLLSRLDAGQLPLRPAAVDVPALLADVDAGGPAGSCACAVGARNRSAPSSTVRASGASAAAAGTRTGYPRSGREGRRRSGRGPGGARPGGRIGGRGACIGSLLVADRQSRAHRRARRSSGAGRVASETAAYAAPVTGA
jgi:hypothetical protein